MLRSPRPQGPPTCEYRKPPEQGLLRFAKKIVTPVQSPLSVRCRGAAVLPPPVNSLRESSSLSEICSTERVPTLAAANSMASGMPSKRLQTCATAPAFCSD